MGPHAYRVGLHQHPYGLRPHMLRMLHIILLVSEIHFGKLNRPALPDDSSVIWEKLQACSAGTHHHAHLDMNVSDLNVQPDFIDVKSTVHLFLLMGYMGMRSSLVSMRILVYTHTLVILDSCGAPPPHVSDVFRSHRSHRSHESRGGHCTLT